MVAQGETVGVLHLQTGPPRVVDSQVVRETLSLEKRHLGLTVAKHLSLALVNLNLREKLRSQSVRDPQTGLFNRRYLEESLEREIRRAARHKTSIGVLFLDLNGLKKTNDQLGHVAGDKLIGEMSYILRNNIRGEDIACRFGGDEFVLVLPGASLKVAKKRAEKLREVARGLVIEQNGKEIGPLSFALGVAVYPAHGSDVDTLFRAADKALYRSKAEGGALVAVAQSKPSGE